MTAKDLERQCVVSQASSGVAVAEKDRETVYFASCACGWVGPKRGPSYAKAEGDVSEHQKDCDRCTAFYADRSPMGKALAVRVQQGSEPLGTFLYSTQAEALAGARRRWKCE